MTVAKTACAAAFSVLWMADTVCTSVFVAKYGVEMEANPVMRWLIATHGILSFIGVKLFLLAFILALKQHVKTWVYAALAVLLLPVSIAGAIVAFT